MDLRKEYLVWSQLGFCGIGSWTLQARLLPIICREAKPEEIYHEVVAVLAEEDNDLVGNGWGEKIAQYVPAIAIASPDTAGRLLEILAQPIVSKDTKLRYHKNDICYIIVGMLKAVIALDDHITDESNSPAHGVFITQLGKIIATQFYPNWTNKPVTSATAQKLWEFDGLFSQHQEFAKGLKEYAKGPKKSGQRARALATMIRPLTERFPARDYEKSGSAFGRAVVDFLSYALLSAGTQHSRLASALSQYPQG